MDTMNREFDLLILQYKTLREEIMEKMKLSHGLGYYKLIAIGALLGFTTTKGIDQKYESSLFLAVMLMPTVFDAALYFIGKAIIKVGTYIRTEIEPNLKRCANTPHNFLLWEEYILSNKSEKMPRLWWNLFEGIQPIMTLVLQIIILVYLLQNKSTWQCIIGGFAIVIEGIILFAAIFKKELKSQTTSDIHISSVCEKTSSNNALIIQNSKLLGLIQPNYSLLQLKAISEFLHNHNTFNFKMLDNWLFPAAELKKETEYTGYNNVWVRDNMHIAYAHYVNGRTETTKNNLLTIASYFKKHKHRFKSILNGKKDSAIPMNRPHIRFNGETLSNSQ